MRVVCLAIALCLLVVSGASARGLVLRRVGAPPLTDTEAAAKVDRRSWEPRSVNEAADNHRPSRAQLRHFHRVSDMPYAAYVNGDFSGTTDEILQWGAYKWGFSPRLFRAVATVETWWHQSFVGDEGSSYGLMQVRVPFHCCLPIIQTSTAFNVDYYGAILRAYYDGRQTFLEQVPHGRDYRAGDLWGSVGVWASGRWHMGTSDSYVQMVKQRVADRVWLTSDFANG
ncbi:MAG: hypothetical protein JWM71_223 [Solirubrobacteraceae bacterium]|nr:hypothetical protein [Solirubrobacteraceae bacterium]